MDPKVSIIMSTYNNAGFLPDALESVLGQSFGEWEFLIINDNSSDDSKDILETFKTKDSRIIVWSNGANQGLTKNLNAALGRAKGEYIARLDSDDVWSDKHKLQKQTDFLNRRPEYCLVGTWAEVSNAGGKKLYDLKYPAQDAAIRKQLLLRNCFVHSSILARRAGILAAGGYDPNRQYIEDYALWLKLGLLAKFANLPEIMVRYRVNAAGVTQSQNSKQIKAILDLIGNYKNNYPGFLKAQFKWRLEGFLVKAMGSGSLIKFK